MQLGSEFETNRSVKTFKRRFVLSFPSRANMTLTPFLHRRRPSSETTCAPSPSSPPPGASPPPLPPTTTTTTTHAPKRPKLDDSSLKKKQKQLTQVHLDFGQKDFHSTRCPVCHLVYTPGKEEDDKLHAAYHNKNANSSLRYNSSKGDSVVAHDATAGEFIRSSIQVHSRSKMVRCHRCRSLYPYFRTLLNVIYQLCSYMN